jgi:hypothetical protein
LQRRLLISTLAVAVTAVLLLGVPLGFALSRLRVGEANQQLRHDAMTLATGLQERLGAGLPPDAAELGRALPDRHVIINQRGGPRTTVGVAPPPHDTITGQASTRDFTVTVEADDSFVNGQVANGLVIISSLGLLAIAVAGRCRNWPAPLTGSARATPGRWGAGTGYRNWTGWPRALTAPHSGSASC